MKLYKIRMNCVGYRDVVVRAMNQDEARKKAEQHFLPCNQPGSEFGEFLPLESGDEQDIEKMF